MTIETVIQSILTPLFFASVIRISTPIIFPAMGSLVSISAGSSNRGLEGLMLIGAFTGVIVSIFTKMLWLSVFSGLLMGVLVALVLAIFHLYLGTPLLFGGLAINLFASGVTIFIMFVLTGYKADTSSFVSLAVPNVHIPLIKDIPFLGEVISGHNVFTYLAFILSFLMYVFLYRTPYGIRMRAVGENPEAAASLGINVKRVKMVAFMISGGLAALGGMNLSMAYLNWFGREMAAGRGWIGIASVALGAKKPLGTMLAAMLFGFSNAIANQFGSLNIPPQLVQMIPYVTTIVALAVYAIQQKQAKLARKKKYQEDGEEKLAAK